MPLFKTHGKYYSQENIGDHYLKSPKENIIYKVIHSKNYEKLYKLLFETHGYCLYLKLMVNIILKKILEVIIQKAPKKISFTK